MSKLKRALISMCVALLTVSTAQAQTLPGSPVYQTWFPQANSPSVAISTTSTAHLYPGTGPTARICNRGSVDVYINPFGTSNSVTTTTNGYWLPISACIAYNIKPSTTQYTYYAALTASGASTLYVETGLGALGSNSGAGSAPPSGVAGGDLYGIYPTPQVGSFSGLLYRTITVASHAAATSADTVIGCNTSAGDVAFQIPVSLGSATRQKRIRVNKISADTNTCCISADGATCLAYLVTPATGAGGGWLDVTADGTSLAFQGTP